MNGIGPKLPLQRDDVYGNYTLISSYAEEIKQNFKNLLLTAPGERMMNPDFGVGLRNYLFEQDSFVFGALRQRIIEQVKRYVPFVRIEEVIAIDLQDIPGERAPTNSLGVQVIYTVPSAGLSDSLTIAFKN